MSKKFRPWRESKGKDGDHRRFVIVIKNSEANGGNANENTVEFLAEKLNIVPQVTENYEICKGISVKNVKSGSKKSDYEK